LSYFAFSDWFEHHVFDKPSSVTYSDPPGRTWGYWTFMVFGRIIHPEYELPPGYFDEYIEIGSVLQTNIFTMFRGLIYDFGLVGSLAFMAGFGWISALVYRRMLTRAVAPVSQALYVLIWGVLYTSYIISLLTWKQRCRSSFRRSAGAGGGGAEAPIAGQPTTA